MTPIFSLFLNLRLSGETSFPNGIWSNVSGNDFRLIIPVFQPCLNEIEKTIKYVILVPVGSCSRLVVTEIDCSLTQCGGVASSIFVSSNVIVHDVSKVKKISVRSDNMYFYFLYCIFPYSFIVVFMILPLRFCESHFL